MTKILSDFDKTDYNEIKKELELLDQLSGMDSLKEILQFLFNEINKISYFDGKFIVLIEESKLKVVHSDLTKDLKNYETMFENGEILLNQLTSNLKQCLYEKKVINICNEDIDKQDNFIKGYFDWWKIKNMVYIPIKKQKETDSLGYLALYHLQENISLESIKHLEDLLSIFYNAIKKGQKIKKLYENQKDFLITKEKYRKVSLASSKVNRLLESRKIYELLLDEVLNIFGFDLTYILIEKDGLMPPLAGAAINNEYYQIFLDLKEYFNKPGNAPSVNPQNPDMACCVAYVLQNHFFLKDTEKLKHLPMKDKDVKSLEIIGQPIRSILHMPIKDKDKPIGVLELFSFNKIVNLTEQDIEMISNLCSFIPSILQNASLHKTLENKNNQLKQELMLAQKIQAKLIPNFYPNIPNAKCFSLYKPMEEIGGDFFDFIKIREENLFGLFISDVSGHGVPAALVTTMVKALIDTSGANRLSPNKFLGYLNNKITNQIGENFLTAFYGLYDSKNKILKFARGGHEYPYLLREGEIIPLKSKGRILGIIVDSSFEEQEVQLQVGDKIIFYTDGLKEARDNEGLEFGESLPDFVRENFHLSIENFVQKMYDDMIDFMVGTEVEDDVCVVGMEIL